MTNEPSPSLVDFLYSRTPTLAFNLFFNFFEKWWAKIDLLNVGKIYFCRSFFPSIRIWLHKFASSSNAVLKKPNWCLFGDRYSCKEVHTKTVSGRENFLFSSSCKNGCTLSHTFSQNKNIFFSSVSSSDFTVTLRARRRQGWKKYFYFMSSFLIFIFIDKFVNDFLSRKGFRKDTLLRDPFSLCWYSVCTKMFAAWKLKRSFMCCHFATCGKGFVRGRRSWSTTCHPSTECPSGRDKSLKSGTLTAGGFNANQGKVTKCSFNCMSVK